MWSNEMEFSFLEVYQTEPVLWEPSHPYHKDKKYVHDGWVRLSEQLNIPVLELKKKKDSLMATFRGHKRRIKASQQSVAGSEDIYKPIWFAFDLMDSFLGHVFDGKNTINTETRSQIEQCPINADVRRKEAAYSFNRVSNKKQLSEDDCDRYAKILANKLRKLSENDRLRFMYEIDGMFIQRISPRPNTNTMPPFPSVKQCVSFPTPLPAHYQRQSSSPYSTYSEASLLEEEDIKISPPSSCHSESSAISDH